MRYRDVFLKEKSFNRTELEQHLKGLGVALRAAGVSLPVRMVIIGGAVMLLEHKMNRKTEDIDALLMMPDLDYYQGHHRSEAYNRFWQVAKQYAKEQNLDPR